MKGAIALRMKMAMITDKGVMEGGRCLDLSAG